MTIAAVPNFRDAYASVIDRYPSPVRSGPWEIRRYTVSQKEANFARLRVDINPQRPYRVVPEGEYLGLYHDRRGIIMSTTPDEIRDYRETYHQASSPACTSVLVAGLGLGMIIHGLLQLPNIQRIQVIEIDKDVISLGMDAFWPEIREGLVSITYGDVLSFAWPKDRHWDVAWFDIWDTQSTENLAEITALKRRYARRATWKGFWSEDMLRSQRHRYGW